MLKYALINSGIVQNISSGDEQWLEAITPNYDDVIDITEESPEPAIGWTYVDGEFAAPVISLATAKAQKIAEFRTSIDCYILASFDLETRFKFTTLYFDAKFEGFDNRAEYIRPLYDWMQAIIAYSREFVLAIQAMSTVFDVQTATWNIEANVPSVPAITLAGAIVIID